MIHFQGVSKKYGHDSTALHDVTLDIAHGEFVSVVGQSGSGKTTLVRLLIAEERPSCGNIEVGDWNITKISRHDVPFLRRQIGVIFQDFKLLPKKTVLENVAFAMQVAGETRSRIREVVPRVLDIVGLKQKSERYPYQLSGGEQQRVVIARSLVHRPKILVADEPTGNLDTINTQDIMEILKKINQFGTTVLLVTHNRDIVNQMKRRVIMLCEGEVVSDEARGKYRL